jgi:hypothetical protein
MDHLDLLKLCNNTVRTGKFEFTNGFQTLFQLYTESKVRKETPEKKENLKKIILFSFNLQKILVNPKPDTSVTFWPV